MATLHPTLIEKDRACLWHPFSQMQTLKPIPIMRADGAFLFSEDGKRYLDATSSWWVNLHGHGHPYILDKIKTQLESMQQIIFADFTHAPGADLAERLLQILPGQMSKIFYSDNGSTAVEAALKIALQYWHNKQIPKYKVISFKNSFHGETFGSMSASGKNDFNQPFWKHLFEIESIDPPIKGQEQTSFSQLKALLDKGDVACFIFEPLVLGVGGMITYPPEGLDRLIELCKQNDVLTIADEVMTGFGRTGTLFACDKLHHQPDLICLAKGLSGGFLPLAATACTQEVYDAFLSLDRSKAFLHGHSYTGNPIACSSALASLDLLLSEDCQLKRQQIEACHRKFCEKWNSHPRLKRCEHLGTLLVVDYQTTQATSLQTMRDNLYHFFIKKGISTRPLGPVLYILPPYCISTSDLQYIYDQIVVTLESNYALNDL